MREVIPSLLLVWSISTLSYPIMGQRDGILHDPGGFPKQVIACAPNSLNITCPTDSTIDIKLGNFGRFTITLCNDGGTQNFNVNCYLESSVSVMQSLCNGQSSCIIHGNHFDISSDPCPGTSRYLEAHYDCIKKSGGLDPPPWLRQGHSQNFGRKPARRVPITAPPKTTRSTTTTSTTSTTASTTKRSKLNQWVLTSPKIATTSQVSDSSPGTKVREDRVTKVIRVNSPVWTQQSPQTSSEIESAEEESSTETVRYVSEAVQQEDLIRSNTEARVRYEESYYSAVTPLLTSSTRSPQDYTKSYRNDLGISDSNQCASEIVREIDWPRSWPDKIVSMPCPPGSQGVATRECRISELEIPFWFGWPDLSNCESDWFLNIKNLFLSQSPITSVSTKLREKSGQFPLYGGDVKGIIDITEGILRNVRYGMSNVDLTNSDGKILQIAEDLQWTLSNLLDQEVLPGWMDLSLLEYESLRTRFIEVTKELGILVQETKYASTHVISTNIETTVEKFPPTKSSEIYEIENKSSVKVSIPKSSFVKSLTKNQKSLVLQEISNVDTIFRFEPSKFHVQASSAFHVEKIASNIISIFSKNAKNLFLPGDPLNLTFRHISADNRHKVCSHWDSHKNTWSPEGCVTVSSNLTHTRCECQYFSTYAVLRQEMEPAEMAQATFWIIITAVSLVLVLAILSTVVLFVWCKKAKVQDKWTSSWYNKADGFDCTRGSRVSLPKHTALYSSMSSFPTMLSFDTANTVPHTDLLLTTSSPLPNYPEETNSKKETTVGDMYLDNQIPCSIHPNLGTTPIFLQNNLTSSLEQNIISDIPIPQRPMFGDFGLHKRQENAGQVSHIYMEVDPNYEVDSGFTEEGDFTGSCSDRKEDSVYNSSSGNSNNMDHEFQQHLSRQRLPLSRSRPDIINMNNQSPIVNALALSHLKRNTMKQPGCRSEAQPQNVFSVSKTIDTRQAGNNNSSDEEQGNGVVWTLQTRRDKSRRQKRNGSSRYKESSMSSPGPGRTAEARGRDNLW